MVTRTKGTRRGQLGILHEAQFAKDLGCITFLLSLLSPSLSQGVSAISIVFL